MSTGNGTTRGYYVEVRAIEGVGIQRVGEFAVAREWKRLPHIWGDGNFGIPRGLYCRVTEAVSDLMSFAAANSLMAWAAASVLLDGLGLEFRLVEAQVTYSWKIDDVAHGAPVNFLERQRQEFPLKPVGAQTQGAGQKTVGGDPSS